MRNNSYENEDCVSPTGSFSSKSISFSFERFRTRPRFETEAPGKSEMVC